MFRILYGTPSHDNDQIASFTEVAKKLAPDADYKYINTLSIEKIEKLGISVLYVPDEWRHEASDTYQEVLNLLKENQLAEVDIAIMHGCFRFQMPILDGMKFVHKESDYLDIVKYYITIGHIHTPNAYERILAPGSFDRLAHGEEENKGALLCNIYNDGKMDFKFLENTKALIFKTLTYLEHTESDIVNNLKKELKKLPKGSYIRIEIKNDNTLLKNLKEFITAYPDYHIKFKTENERELFRELIKISGVGPKLTLAILSTYNVKDVINIVLDNNSKLFTKVPGLGEKKAQKIILDLKDKVKKEIKEDFDIL